MEAGCKAVTATMPGTMSAAQMRAFRKFDADLAALVNEANDAGVLRGLVVALLHAAAHQQTAAMLSQA